jgi:2',3'-cyclic-nucleotide 2'-phosphodiesterase (5'-nucleotidase family)
MSNRSFFSVLLFVFFLAGSIQAQQPGEEKKPVEPQVQETAEADKSLKPKKPVEKGVSIFFTGYVRGNYKPCGCKEDPSGGLARRMGYLSEFRGKSKDTVINVELGSYLSLPSPDSDSINQLMLEALSEIPVDVFHLNAWDVPHWQSIAKLKGYSAKTLSSNIIWPSDQKKKPRPFIVKKIEISKEKSIRLGFIGISDPKTFAKNSKFHAANSYKVVSRLFEKHSEKADYWILLTDLSSAAARILAKDHSGIIAVLIMGKSYRIAKPTQVNNAVVLESIERGRQLGKLRLVFNSEGKLVSYMPGFVSMNDKIKDDEKMAAKIEELSEKLAEVQSKSD